MNQQADHRVRDINQNRIFKLFLRFLFLSMNLQYSPPLQPGDLERMEWAGWQNSGKVQLEGFEGPRLHRLNVCNVWDWKCRIIVNTFSSLPSGGLGLTRWARISSFPARPSKRFSKIEFQFLVSGFRHKYNHTQPARPSKKVFINWVSIFGFRFLS